MKRLIFLTILCLLGFSIQAQQKVSKNDLDGVWEMVFDFDEDDWDEELEDEGFFERVIGSAVSGMVFNILDDLKIQFEFLNNNELRLTVEIWDEKEVEYTDWYINRHGELIIGDDYDDDEIWMLDNGKLVAYEINRNGKFRDKHIYLKKVK